MKTLASLSRRNFVKKAALSTVATSALGSLLQPVRSEPSTVNKGVYSIGPMEGYSPQVGTLVSMLNYTGIQ